MCVWILMFMYLLHCNFFIWKLSIWSREKIVKKNQIQFDIQNNTQMKKKKTVSNVLVLNTLLLFYLKYIIFFIVCYRHHHAVPLKITKYIVKCTKTRTYAKWQTERHIVRIYHLRMCMCFYRTWYSDRIERKWELSKKSERKTLSEGKKGRIVAHIKCHTYLDMINSLSLALAR